MKFVLLFSLLVFFSCKRNHSSVFVKVLDKETNVPLNGAKVQVIRKGKEGLLKDKESLLVGENYTNANGEVLVNFKYDRGNVYALFVYEAKEYFQNTSYQYFDLEKGRNSEKVYMNQLSYIKLHLISNNPDSKILYVRINDFTPVYDSFYHTTNPLDTFVFCKVSSAAGNKAITWRVDSAWFEKNYSLPIQLKGHDTAYATINF